MILKNHDKKQKENSKITKKNFFPCHLSLLSNQFFLEAND
jgi:hypothetical protein